MRGEERKLMEVSGTENKDRRWNQGYAAELAGSSRPHPHRFHAAEAATPGPAHSQ